MTPVFFNMIDQRLLDIPVFGVWLNPDPSMEPAGSIRFGNVDTARYEGGITDLPVPLFFCQPLPPLCYSLRIVRAVRQHQH